MNAELKPNEVIATHDRREAPATLPSLFDLIVTAPEGLNRLRRLILEFAVRGRLVEQDPCDEHASKLLERVRRERELMVARGEIKRSEEPQGGDGLPSSLPTGWAQVRLGTVICLISGQHLKPGEYQHTPEAAIPYLTGPAEFGARYPQPKRWTRLRRAVARAGDILVTVKGAGVGKLNIVQSAELAISRQLMAVRVIGVNQHFIEIALRALAESLRSKSIGIAIPGISREDINDAIIQLPPLTEQRRIAVRFAELMNVCDFLEENGRLESEQHLRLTSVLFDSLVVSESPKGLIETWQRVASHFDLLLDRPESVDALEKRILDLALRGLLVDHNPSDQPAEQLLVELLRARNALTPNRRGKQANVVVPAPAGDHPFALPESWIWTSFANIAIISSMLVSPKDHPTARQVAPDCIEKATGRLVLSRTVRQSGVKSPNHKFRSGQILYSKIRPSLSKVVLVDCSGLCSADMYPIDARINPEYLHLFMLSSCFLTQVQRAENRVKMPKLNQDSLNSLLVAVPPNPEQERIVAVVHRLRRLCTQLRESLTAQSSARTRFAEAIVTRDCSGTR